VAASKGSYLQPSITFDGDSASACPGSSTDSGYVHLSVAKWGLNPNAGSERVESSLFGAKMYTTSTIDADLWPDFKYYMTLPFTAVQDFAVNRTNTTESWNVTIPECYTYSETALMYEPCSGCSLSTYDNESVTFVCTDISQVCSSTNSSSSSIERRLSRQLQSFDDDYASGASVGNGNIGQIGTIFKAVPGELSKNLSFNPFNANTAKAKLILSAMSTFLFIIVAGLWFFADWDKKVGLLRLVYNLRSYGHHEYHHQTTRLTFNTNISSFSNHFTGIPHHNIRGKAQRRTIDVREGKDRKRKRERD
jgi:hypothetical protein